MHPHWLLHRLLPRRLQRRPQRLLQQLAGVRHPRQLWRLELWQRGQPGLLQGLAQGSQALQALPHEVGRVGHCDLGQVFYTLHLPDGCLQVQVGQHILQGGGMQARHPQRTQWNHKYTLNRPWSEVRHVPAAAEPLLPPPPKDYLPLVLLRPPECNTGFSG